MASDLPDGLADLFVLARQASWAGDYLQADKYLSEAAARVAPRSSRHMSQYTSLEDLLASDIKIIKRQLDRLVSRDEKDSVADLRSGENPYVSSSVLRGVIYSDGFGQFYLRAYLTNLSIETMFRSCVDLAASKAEGDSQPARQGEVGADEVLVDVSRQWIDSSGSPNVYLHVGEFPLISGKGLWCPLPDNAEKVRARFAMALRSIDPRDSDWNIAMNDDLSREPPDP